MNQKKDASDDRDKLKQAVIFLTNNVQKAKLADMV